jgi:hypothetical protein
MTLVALSHKPSRPGAGRDSTRREGRAEDFVALSHLHTFGTVP